MASFTCSVGDVAAMRAGMMNGTFDEGLPSASSTMPHFSFSTRRKVFASTASYLSMNFASTPPIASRALQRFNDAITSSLVTGLPSWNSRPSRKVKVHCRPSDEVVYLSTICGLISPFWFTPNSVS